MRKREGIEPRYGRETVGADVVSNTEGHIDGAALAMAPANPPGSETGARHHGKAGNSGGPLGSSRSEVGWHNRHTGRKPNDPEEVGCPHTSEDVE
jgi:hypothetical protein